MEAMSTVKERCNQVVVSERKSCVWMKTDILGSAEGGEMSQQKP